MSFHVENVALLKASIGQGRLSTDLGFYDARLEGWVQGYSNNAMVVIKKCIWVEFCLMFFIPIFTYSF